MRTVTFGVACSLDMFIARKDSGVDWLHWSDDVTALMNEYWKTIDTILMGRKTYEVSLKMGGGGGAYSGMKTYVFSRTWKDRRDPNVEIVPDDAAEFVRDLKNRGGKNICCMGGGEFARSLFEAGVIDEVGLNIHPILLGSGIPLFLEMRQVDLELVECKTIKGGCVYVLYRVKK